MIENGVVWASFKTGTKEGADALGRYFNYLQRDELISIWREAAPWRDIETEAWLGGAYDRRGPEWMAITAIK